MKKALIGSLMTISMISNPIWAHEDSCSFSFDHDLSVMDNAITISNSSTDKIYIDSSNQLYINDIAQPLSSEQQQMVDAYANNIRLLIPEVISIATEGVGLGIDAASLAMGTLFGEGDPDYLEFTQRIQELGDKILMRLDANQFDSKALEQAFDKEFEAEIEAFAEDTVNQLMPRLMAKAMAAAMSNDASAGDFEMRADRIEHEVTAFIEPRAEALEARAEELCEIIVTLDGIEAQMVETGLSKMDLIRADANGSINLNKLDKLKDSKHYKILGNGN